MPAHKIKGDIRRKKAFKRHATKVTRINNKESLSTANNCIKYENGHCYNNIYLDKAGRWKLSIAGGAYSEPNTKKIETIDRMHSRNNKYDI